MTRIASGTTAGGIWVTPTKRHGGTMLIRRTHYDIGADDNENIALVYPAEYGDLVTVRRARLFANAREAERQRDKLLAALKRAETLFRVPPEDALGADYVNQA